MRGFIAGFATAYVFAGLVIGLALATAVPATNARGVAYIIAIWPAWVAQPYTGFDVPVPAWSFTFKDK